MSVETVDFGLNLLQRQGQGIIGVGNTLTHFGVLSESSATHFPDLHPLGAFVWAYFKQGGSPGVGPGVHHVNPRSVEAGKDQPVAFLGGVSEAAAAGIPPRMVQLIINVGHRQAVDDLWGDRTHLGPETKCYWFW